MQLLGQCKEASESQKIGCFLCQGRSAYGDFGQSGVLLWLCICLTIVRMSASEIVALADAMQIPEVLSTTSRFKFTAIEALCLLLACFRSSGDIYELTSRHNRTESAISEVVNELTVFIDQKWSHLLAFDSDGLLSRQQLEQYADAIHRAGAPVGSIWGFIDCTICAMCKPSWWQRVAYSGHKKLHALKFQAVRLPNGLFGHLHGPVEGRRNDAHLLEDSGLLDKCKEYAVREGTDASTPAADCSTTFRRSCIWCYLSDSEPIRRHRTTNGGRAGME